MSGSGQRRFKPVFLLLLTLLPSCVFAAPQSLETAGTIQGHVTDSSGAVIPGAHVEICAPLSSYQHSVDTDLSGAFRFRNVPFNAYRLRVTALGFQPVEREVLLPSSVPVDISVALSVAGSSQTVTVEGGSGDLVQGDPVSHTDINRSLAARLPSQSINSALSSVLTLATPGVAADSNGVFHPLGEHAEASFIVDNQPIADQQSRIFSNQLSLSSIQSMEVINGVPPAEFGDKTSLVVRTITRSGLGSPRPTANVSVGYGSFGTATASLSFAMGGQRFGNFLSVDGVGSGRFLDPPELRPVHAKGNAENFFDRMDYQLDEASTLHLNLSAARSWAQAANSLDQQAAGQDQRQILRSFNVALGYTHLFNAATLLTANAFVRQDRAGYLPSSNLFFDQPASLSQRRRLTNAGLKIDLAYVSGIHNLKAGFQFSHTMLSESFQTGLTDPAFNAVCLDGAGAPVTDPTITNPGQCGGAGFTANPDFEAGFLPYDLTRGGSLFNFRGKGHIKQEAVYLQDSLSLRRLTLMLGIRADNYNGLSSRSAVQPRAGLAYHIKRTNTVLRGSYGRMFLTPYNENLLLSSATGQGGLATGVLGSSPSQPLVPARRNQFDVGLQQGLGNRFVVDAEYFWKFTRGAYDFNVLLNTPLNFPTQYRESKIDGLLVRVNFRESHGVSAYSVLGHTRSRLFGPEVGGIDFDTKFPSVFRPDHDQAFQQSTHLRYQPKKSAPWVAFTWRYDSGLVAVSVPDYATALRLSGDQQAQMGLFCGNLIATPSAPLRSCSSPHFGATRVNIPAPGTYDADRNPSRIVPRHLFDLGLGVDNVLRADRYQIHLRLSVINLTNKVALYNFLSGFSGTHFVTPRSYQAEMGFSF